VNEHRHQWFKVYEQGTLAEFARCAHCGAVESIRGSIRERFANHTSEVQRVYVNAVDTIPVEEYLESLSDYLPPGLVRL
jgi:hypothetical protein